jgi:hypothetical protein
MNDVPTLTICTASVSGGCAGSFTIGVSITRFNHGHAEGDARLASVFGIELS